MGLYYVKYLENPFKYPNTISSDKVKKATKEDQEIWRLTQTNEKILYKIAWFKFLKIWPSNNLSNLKSAGSKNPQRY